MKRYLPILLLITLIIPSIALASWWNPFSWFNNWGNENKTEILEKRIQELEAKIATTTNSTETINAKQPQQKALPVVKAETWEELESRYFKDADGKGWTSLEIDNGLGETRYYLKTDNKWIRKNSKEELGNPCNGKSFTFCPSGQNFICPDTGNGYCEIPNVNNQVNNTNRVGKINVQVDNKQKKLNEINQQIASLNAKYAQDIKDVDINNAGRGIPTSISNGQKAEIYRKYVDNYNSLMAEYQQVQYSN
jgi:hypothetical protein